MPVSIFGITVGDRRNRIITNTSDRFYAEIEQDILNLFDRINRHDDLLNAIIGEIERIRYKLTKRITNSTTNIVT